MQETSATLRWKPWAAGDGAPSRRRLRGSRRLTATTRRALFFTSGGSTRLASMSSSRQPGSLASSSAWACSTRP